MSRTTIIVLIVLTVLGVTLSVLSFRYDDVTRQKIVEIQGKNWKKSEVLAFVSAVRKYGDWPQLMIAGGIGCLVAWRLKKREWIRILAAAMIASTLAGMLANTSRLTTGRTRPRESPKMEHRFYGPWHEGKTTIGNSKYNSFPSGHTATAFGFAGVLLFASLWLGICAMLLAALIGWASMMIGAHYFSDIITSIVLSLFVAWFTWRWAQSRGDQAWSWLRQKLSRFRKA